MKTLQGQPLNNQQFVNTPNPVVNSSSPTRPDPTSKVGMAIAEAGKNQDDAAKVELTGKLHNVTLTSAQKVLVGKLADHVLSHTTNEQARIAEKAGYPAEAGLTGLISDLTEIKQALGL